MGKYTPQKCLLRLHYHFEAETKLPPFRRRHFQMHFREWKCMNFTSLKISLKCVSKFRINNIPTLVQIMVWRRPGDKPLSEPMMALLTDAYMRHSASMSLQLGDPLICQIIAVAVGPFLIEFNHLCFFLKLYWLSFQHRGSGMEYIIATAALRKIC